MPLVNSEKMMNCSRSVCSSVGLIDVTPSSCNSVRVEISLDQVFRPEQGHRVVAVVERLLGDGVAHVHDGHGDGVLDLAKLTCIVLAPMPSTVAPARSRRRAEAARISPVAVPVAFSLQWHDGAEVDRVDDELRLGPLVRAREEFVEVAIVRGRRLPREAADDSNSRFGHGGSRSN